MKLKKLVKNAIKNPKLFTQEEILFFKNWLFLNKKNKEKK
tara:strand:- start:1572 stop:1691 length:120 start_codon:yes stop_codon:yes gene_type:complete